MEKLILIYVAAQVTNNFSKKFDKMKNNLIYVEIIQIILRYAHFGNAHGLGL